MIKVEEDYALEPENAPTVIPSDNANTSSSSQSHTTNEQDIETPCPKDAKRAKKENYVKAKNKTKRKKEIKIPRALLQ